MDGFGQIGPDKGNYAADVKATVTELEAGGPVYLALADRGTKYELVLVLADRIAAMELAALRRSFGADSTQDWLFVGWLGHGAYWFKLDGGYIAPSYVAKSFGVESEADGEVLAEFLTRLQAARQMEVAS